MQTAPNRQSVKATSWSYAWSQPAFRIKFIVAWALVLSILAGFHIFFEHIEKREGPILDDWLLNQIPSYNVSVPVFICIWGATLIAIIRSIKYPQTCLLMATSYLLVSLTRILSIWFISLNPPNGLIPLVDPLTNFFYGKQYITKDLFFSGHTSSVFIIFLCLTKRSDKIITGVLCIILAVLLLVQHVHYTIDILAAPVISYGCYLLAKWLVAEIN